MLSTKLPKRIVLLFACYLIGCILNITTTDTRCQAATLLARSQFNIPPYTAGIPVGGQGASDPGWAAPWQKLGGFDDRGHVVTSPTEEGNGAVQLFADRVFGTSVEREWFDIVPKVRVDAYVYVEPGASMQGQIVTATPASGEIPPRTAGMFKVEGSGAISVWDTSVNGLIDTGFHTIPREWNKYSLIVNMETNNYRFLFNDQEFHAGHRLTLKNPMFYVDGINYSASEVLTTYVDNVSVWMVPEPASMTLVMTGLLVCCGAALRRRRKLA